LPCFELKGRPQLVLLPVIPELQELVGFRHLKL